MKMNPFMLGLSLLLSLLGACKKENKAEDPCTTSQQGLAGTYRLTALKYKMSASSPEQDYLVFLDACERDDLITLNANGSYSYQDAGTSCTPSGNDSGTWTVTGNTISSDGMVNGTITSYDCRTLIYHVDNMLVSGDRYIFTMVKQ
jgi:Lipocalin-like domain